MVKHSTKDKTDDDKLHILLFFSRHGERADRSYSEDTDGMIRCDPYITDQGKMEAFNIGKKIANYVHEKKNESYGLLLQEHIQSVYMNKSVIEKVREA